VEESIPFSEITDRLASASAERTYYLTSQRDGEADYLQDLSFRCLGNSGEQKYIEIGFSLNVSKIRPTSLEFKSGVVTRN